MLAEFNESDAMARGVLFAPVSLPPNMADKRAFQPAVNQNIRESSFYIQVRDDDWGPAERNFEADYKLALACVDDPASPMRQAVLLESSSIEDFSSRVGGLLEDWLAVISADVALSRSSA